MDKLIVTDLNTKERRERVDATKVPTRRRRAADGKVETVYVLNTADPNFSDQFEKVFKLNVRRARRTAPKPTAIAAE
jgi:hypothetical protein